MVEAACLLDSQGGLNRPLKYTTVWGVFVTTLARSFSCSYFSVGINKLSHPQLHACIGQCYEEDFSEDSVHGGSLADVITTEYRHPFHATCSRPDHGMQQ